MYNELNNLIVRHANKIKYTVSDLAPNTERDLFNTSSLVVWSGASDQTIWNDPAVNHAFRALHDQLHISTRLPFTIEGEKELGRIQANQYSGLMADLIYIEVAKQVEYYERTGEFVNNQIDFVIAELKKLGYYLNEVA